jgi:hypothetical protein
MFNSSIPVKGQEKWTNIPVCRFYCLVAHNTADIALVRNSIRNLGKVILSWTLISMIENKTYKSEFAPSDLCMVFPGKPWKPDES